MQGYRETLQATGRKMQGYRVSLQATGRSMQGQKENSTSMYGNTFSLIQEN